MKIDREEEYHDLALDGAMVITGIIRYAYFLLISPLAILGWLYRRLK